MPQAYRAENISLVVDVDGFTIHRPVKTCNRVNRAIARYTNHIKSKVVHLLHCVVIMTVAL